MAYSGNLQGAAANWKVSEADILSSEVNTSTPTELAQQFDILQDAYMYLIEPKDLTANITSEQFDFVQLCDNMKEICPDFSDPVAEGTSQYQLSFAAKVIYEIGPESRKVKAGTTRDKVWRLKFLCNNSGTVVMKCLNICTFKNVNVPSNVNKVDKNNMIVSVKHASLLAIVPFNAFVKYAYSINKGPLLTPLAGAVFCRDTIKDIANETGYTELAVNIIINSSCQSGGHYLNNSRLDCAVAAATATTKNLKDVKVTASIVNKVAKQYLLRQKDYEQGICNVFHKYATGGLPQHLTYESLVDAANNAKSKITIMQAQAASTQSAAHAMTSPGMAQIIKQTIQSIMGQQGARPPSPPPGGSNAP